MIRAKTLFIFFMLGACTQAFSQKYKYKELVPLLAEASPSEQITLVSEFIATEMHPAAIFRFTLLHYDVFKKTDPLTEYQKAMAYADVASKRIVQVKLLVKESEVKSNNEYYTPLFNTVDEKGRPSVEFAVVNKKVVNMEDSVKRFLERMPAIYKAFTKSVSSYDRAVKLFAEVNTTYKSKEDILMLMNDNIINQLDELKRSYDSSIFYFNTYLSLTKDYPLPNYSQKMKINTIHVYRLDGFITRLSFLTPEVTFWNYSLWVDDIKKMYSTEIVKLKDQIDKSEIHIDETLKKIESGTTDLSLARLDKNIVFNLNNYDRGSLALSLLEYKTYKQNWQLKAANIRYDTTLERRLEGYSQLIQYNRASDSLLQVVTINVNAKNINKHRSFIDKYYQGETGLKDFLSIENKFIVDSFSSYQNVLENNLETFLEQPMDDINKLLKFPGNYTVPLWIQNKSTDELNTTQDLLTQIKKKNSDGSVYLAGQHKRNKKTNNLIGFLAKVNADGKPAWIKEFNLPVDSLGLLDANNYINDIVPAQEGCAVVISSIRNGQKEVMNTFIYFLESGIEKIRIPLKEKAVARKIIYQESNNSFVMGFKGWLPLHDYTTRETGSILSINVLGDVIWRSDVELAGTIEDIVSVRDGYLVGGNFTFLQDKKAGKEYRTKVNENQSNPFLLKLSTKGDQLEMMPIVTNKSVCLTHIVKVNDGSINLMSAERPFNSNSSDGSYRNTLHYMTTYSLKKICANF